MNIIKVSKDFSDTPGGRFKNKGSFSGEAFREEILEREFLTCLNNNETLTIDLDDCYGFPSSFIDESFGQLGRKYGAKNVLNVINFISKDEPPLINDIKKIILGDK